MALASLIAHSAGLAGCEPGTLECGGPAADDGYCRLRGLGPDAAPRIDGGVADAGLADAAPTDAAPPPRDASADGGLPPADAGDPRGDGGPRDAAPRGDAPDAGGDDAGPGPVESDAACAPAPVVRHEPEPSGGAGGNPAGGDILVDILGISRTYRLHVPPCYTADRPWGLALVLHDDDGDREYLRLKWERAARDREFLVALPLALRTFDNKFGWLDNPAANAALIGAAIEGVEAAYQVDLRATMLTGLGVGATFAMDLTSEAANGAVEHLLAVGPAFYDPRAEASAKVFVIEGVTESIALARREPSSRFRYEFVEGLGPYYPGPRLPAWPEDPGLESTSAQTAIDWFHTR